MRVLLLQYVVRSLGAGVVLATFALGVACRTAAPASTPTPVPVPNPAPASPGIVVPGAPGEESRIVTAPSTVVKIPHVAADVAFMQGMIGHHAQALDMVELLETRTASEAMKLLGLRIKVSQEDEIRFMRRWLDERGETVPGPHAHHAAGFTPMPGMLTAEEMAALAAASGPAFDKLFLEGMIKHHEGALIMAEDLFTRDGAGQEASINAFAADVVADQQMEIDRMKRLWMEMQR